MVYDKNLINEAVLADEKNAKYPYSGAPLRFEICHDDRLFGAVSHFNNLVSQIIGGWMHGLARPWLKVMFYLP